MEKGELEIIQDLMKFQSPMFPNQILPNPHKLLKEGPALIKRIKKKNPDLCSDQFKIQCVQFFIQFYTTRMFLLAPISRKDDLKKIKTNNVEGLSKKNKVDPQRIKEFKRDQIVDMEFAWKLLDTNWRSEPLQTASIMFKIEIGQRLESSIKLSNALESIPQNSTDIQVLMVVFTAIPLIGRWQQFIDIGKMLPPQAFEQFSQVSQNMPVPDYSILYEIAKEEKAYKFPVPNPNSLSWIQYDIESIRVKFRDLNCEEFVEKQKELLDQINHNNGNNFWENVPNPQTIHLRRMGAIYQCISFSENPQQLCGLFNENRIKVRGKTQVVTGPSGMDPSLILNNQTQVTTNELQILVQEELWDLKRDKEKKNVFKGTYKIHNYTPSKSGKKVLDPNRIPLHMVFDLELTMHSMDQLSIESKTKNLDNDDLILTEFDELSLD